MGRFVAVELLPTFAPELGLAIASGLNTDGRQMGRLREVYEMFRPQRIGVCSVAQVWPNGKVVNRRRNGMLSHHAKSKMKASKSSRMNNVSMIVLVGVPEWGMWL